MYLISAYFDEQTNQIINRYIQQLAAKTRNTFMTDNRVPPHMTISSLEARQGEVLFPCLEKLQGQLVTGRVSLVCIPWMRMGSVDIVIFSRKVISRFPVV